MFFWRQRIEPSGRSFGVEWGFTDRWGGSSQGSFGEFNLGAHVGDVQEAVHTNRHRLAHELSLRLTDLRFMDQQHGCAVAVTPGTATKNTKGERSFVDDGDAPPVDGLVSGGTEEALVVLVADCTPVLLLDRVEGLVAVVHAGRPGMVSGVIPATLRRLRELGATSLEAVVGPSVCPRCYEVPEAMRDAAAAVEPVAAGTSWAGTAAIDVASAVVAQLAREDVRLTWLPGCTREDADLYSYRRDGRTGRFAGIVRLLAPQEVA
ncbi:MAG: polyphenol oxidase family protein [Ornithinimicrobium sp.]|uniref:polyphenol oxidase family protein n=1 Tax=Ornithinimicrobium sp. TaxID=1977084 RepID=UPI0026DFABD7|nr:polyphenol oxidase family protein [Ornithinimicrobium sp.]MDO5741257.1 polyphenol oxidase family protein [Ornithinimicrobium sp.]